MSQLGALNRTVNSITESISLLCPVLSGLWIMGTSFRICYFDSFSCTYVRGAFLELSLLFGICEILAIFCKIRIFCKILGNFVERVLITTGEIPVEAGALPLLALSPVLKIYVEVITGIHPFSSSSWFSIRLLKAV